MMKLLQIKNPCEWNLKLLKISESAFTGKFEDWILFKSQFTSLIIGNNELIENKKLYYLHSTLKGEAKILETCDENLSSHFKALEQRFENKRVIVDSYIRNILNVQSIKNESRDSRNLRNRVASTSTTFQNSLTFPENFPWLWSLHATVKYINQHSH